MKTVIGENLLRFCFWFLCGASLLSAAEPQVLGATKLFERFGREDFAEFSKSEIPTISMGPMVPLDDQREIHSSVLEYQAELVAEGGLASFEVAFRHLDDKRLFIRWIAVASLYRITGKKPLWYLFAEPGQTWNGNSAWSDRAKAVWKQWEAQQVAAPDH